MRWDNESVRNGMFVVGTQGERVGKVIRCDAETFVVEKGVFFPKDYELRYDHITDIAGGTVRYALNDFLRGRNIEEPVPATTSPTAASKTPRSAARGEIRIPLVREEIGIEKIARESGHLRIHKTVHTEEKHFSVPVTREEVVIEHIVADHDAPLTGDVSFQEETVDVPLYEEEVRVSKRPYLDEEVVVRTIAHSIDREGSALLRHEEADVEDTRKSADADEDAADVHSEDTDTDTRR